MKTTTIAVSNDTKLKLRKIKAELAVQKGIFHTDDEILRILIKKFQEEK